MSNFAQMTFTVYLSLFFSIHRQLIRVRVSCLFNYTGCLPHNCSRVKKLFDGWLRFLSFFLFLMIICKRDILSILLTKNWGIRC